MTDHSNISEPQDICVLLRAHGEEHWLISEVLPVLRELEQPGAIPEDQLGAALAYLELLWFDARRRAAETDAAYARLDPADSLRNDPILHEKAARYHAAVRRLRAKLAHLVRERTWAEDDALPSQHAHL
ncbi:MAG TPA: hypothetical protein VII03_00995 [Solirubrobacteraceae bacterium]